jgi:hypothetical protein
VREAADRAHRPFEMREHLDRDGILRLEISGELDLAVMDHRRRSGGGGRAAGPSGAATAAGAGGPGAAGGPLEARPHEPLGAWGRRRARHRAAIASARGLARRRVSASASRAHGDRQSEHSDRAIRNSAATNPAPDRPAEGGRPLGRECVLARRTVHGRSARRKLRRRALMATHCAATPCRGHARPPANTRFQRVCFLMPLRVLPIAFFSFP